MTPTQGFLTASGEASAALTAHPIKAEWFEGGLGKVNLSVQNLSVQNLNAQNLSAQNLQVQRAEPLPWYRGWYRAWLHWPHLLGIWLMLGWLGEPLVAQGQIVPDGTLGAEGSRLTPQVLIRGQWGDRIEGGAQRGGALFHSFGEFNVQSGQRVYFSNPSGIDAILTRVTGGNPSQIQGTLGVDGGASLFLLNPQGILFGPGASLDVAGSFMATTAPRWVLPGGEEYSAINPQQPPLLSIEVDPGVQWGGIRSGLLDAAGFSEGTVRVEGRLGVGQAVALQGQSVEIAGTVQAGGDLRIEAATDLRVQDTATTPVHLQAGDRLHLSGQTLSLETLAHPTSFVSAGGDVVLQADQPIIGDVKLRSGGSVRIETRSGAPNDLISPNDPVILANQDFTAGNYTGNSLHVLAGGSIRLGAVTITGPDASTGINPSQTPTLATVPLSNGQSLTIDGGAQATLDVRAGIDWSQLGGLPGNQSFGITPPAGAFGTTTGASIQIASVRVASPGGLVLLTNQYRPTGALIGDIRVGNLDTSSTVGAGGQVILDSRSGIVLQNQTLNTTSSQGNGGSITALARGELRLDNSQWITAGLSDTGGDAGAVTIQAGSVLLQTNSLISTSNATPKTSGVPNTGLGRAGALQIQAGQVGAPGDILLRNSTVISRNGDGAIAPAEALQIQGRSLQLSDGSLLATQTSGAAAAADLRIQVDRLSLDRSRIESSSSSSGAAGTLQVRSGETTLANGSEIRSLSASGLGGDLSLIAQRQLSLRQRSQISTVVGSEGSGGSGGNLTLETPRISASDNSDISTRALSGSGGLLVLRVPNSGPASPGASPSSPLLDNISVLSSSELARRLGVTLELANPQTLPSNDIVAIRPTPLPTQAPAPSPSPESSLDTLRLELPIDTLTPEQLSTLLHHAICAKQRTEGHPVTSGADLTPGLCPSSSLPSPLEAPGIPADLGKSQEATQIWQGSDGEIQLR